MPREILQVKAKSYLLTMIRRRKQWMMTLSELGLGRDMVGEDFAHFVKLFQDAEAQALSREVLFNGDLNTHADVFAYVRASGVLDSEAKLLDFIKNSPLADPVTYIDTPQPQSSGMYMHHTISRDLSGTNDQVTSKLLAALGERSSRRADLSILAERSTRKTDLSILSERSSRRADLSLLVSKSEESTSTKRTERLPFRH